MASSAANSLGLKEPSLVRTQALIGGKWRDAKDGATFEVTNPANHEVLVKVADLGVEETKEAVASAKEAFKTWSQTTAKERHDLLLKLRDLLHQHHDDLARLITLENGKVLADSKSENTYSASFFEWFAEESVRHYGETIPPQLPKFRGLTIRQPVGVVALLAPWNFPSTMVARKLAPALAAGCTAVIKPAMEAPLSSLAIAELAIRAGFPPGVVNVVPSHSHTPDVGKELCENKDVRKISFTGSTGIGRLLYKQASSNIKKISLELGGNAPFIVFNDADVDEAVAGAVVCKFRSSGQTCVCANRLYIQSGIYPEFAARLAEKVEQFKVGNGLDENVTHGPLIHSRALDKVEAHIKDAVEKGASIVTGGKRLEGNFFQPTILADVPTSAQVSRDETFGPLAALIKFETEQEVIQLANDTEFGLAGYIYSRDVGRAWRVAESIEVGMVGVNTGLLSSAAIPFGGVKESGLGREGSKHGLDEYTQIKYIAFGGL